MKKKASTRDDLRSRAEEALGSGEDSSIERSGENVLQLVHELRVHQVELEIQNEELRSAQARIEESRMRYADLYDFAPVGYLTFDHQGLIVEANLTAARQLGTERSSLVERPFFLYVSKRDREAFRLHLAKVLKTRERQTCEMKLDPGKLEGFFARLDSIFFEDASGKGLVRASISDISSSKQAEEVLKRAHGELEERVAQRTAELSIANEQLMREVEERRQREIQTQAVNALLKLSLEDLSLEELLGRGLDLFLSIPWLSLDSMGCVFLIEGESEELVMKAQTGLTGEMLASCRQVPFGKCVCGRAMLESKIQSIRCSDCHHDLSSVLPLHSHYCVPILFSGKPLGLISLYVNANHHEDPREQEFLTAVANTLAGIIERKRIEEALRQSGEKYQELVENANSIIMRIDTEGNILFCNEFAQRFFGFAKEELFGRNVVGTILPEIDSYGRNLAAMVEDIMMHPERYVNDEHENMRRSGERVWIAWTNKPVVDKDGRIKGLLVIGTDITARKRAEDELSAYAERLELLNRELQEFAFVASHDMQEPLRKIQSFSSRIEADYGDSLGDAGRDSLMRIKRSASWMSGLVKALLDYSRVAVKLEAFEKVDLGRVARNAASDLLQELKLENAHVEIAELPSIDADPHQMSELFLNLISNALKFRRKEEPPVIKIYGRNEKEVTTIFVEDNGIGFDEKYLDRIFTPLQRLHAKGKYDGMGMGLAICRKIAERHKGSLAARSMPGRGSTFSITLPFRQTGKI